jgi:hypothetical protein
MTFTSDPSIKKLVSQQLKKKEGYIKWTETEK